MRKGLIKQPWHNITVVYDKKIRNDQFAMFEVTVNNGETIKIVSSMSDSGIIHRVSRYIKYEIKTLNVKTLRTWSRTSKY